MSQGVDKPAIRLLRAKPSGFELFAIIHNLVYAAIGVLVALLAHPIGWMFGLIFFCAACGTALFEYPPGSYLRVGPRGFTACVCYLSCSFRWSEVGEFGVEAYCFVTRGRVAFTHASGQKHFLNYTYGLTLEALADLLNEHRERYGCLTAKQ